MSKKSSRPLSPLGVAKRASDGAPLLSATSADGGPGGAGGKGAPTARRPVAAKSSSRDVSTGAPGSKGVPTAEHSAMGAALGNLTAGLTTRRAPDSARRESAILFDTERKYHSASFNAGVAIRFFLYHVLYPASIPAVVAIDGWRAAVNLAFICSPLRFQEFLNQVVFPCLVVTMVIWTFFLQANESDALVSAVALLLSTYIIRIASIAIKYGFYTPAELASLRTSLWSYDALYWQTLKTWIHPPVDLIRYQVRLAALHFGVPTGARNMFCFIATNDTIPQIAELLWPSSSPVLQERYKLECGVEQIQFASTHAPERCVVIPGEFIAESLFIQESVAKYRVRRKTLLGPTIAAIANIALLWVSAITDHGFTDVAGVTGWLVFTVSTLLTLFYLSIVCTFLVASAVEYNRRAGIMRRVVALLEANRTVWIGNGVPIVSQWWGTLSTVYMQNVSSLFRLYLLASHIGYGYRARIQAIVGGAVVLTVGAAAILFLRLLYGDFESTAIVALFVIDFVLIISILGRILLDGIRSNQVGAMLRGTLIRAELSQRRDLIAASADRRTEARQSVEAAKSFANDVLEAIANDNVLRQRSHSGHPTENPMIRAAASSRFVRAGSGVDDMPVIKDAVESVVPLETMVAKDLVASSRRHFGLIRQFKERVGAWAQLETRVKSVKVGVAVVRELRSLTAAVRLYETTNPITVLGIPATAGLFNTLGAVAVSVAAAGVRQLISILLRLTTGE